MQHVEISGHYFISRSCALESVTILERLVSCAQNWALVFDTFDIDNWQEVLRHSVNMPGTQLPMVQNMVMEVCRVHLHEPLWEHLRVLLAALPGMHQLLITPDNGRGRTHRTP